MIASIRGEVISRYAGEVVIEAAGVGYKLAVSSETLSSVPAAGELARLLTHLVLRDDAMHLYGFSTQSELPGRTRHRQAHRGADHRRAA